MYVAIQSRKPSGPSGCRPTPCLPNSFKAATVKGCGIISPLFDLCRWIAVDCRSVQYSLEGPTKRIKARLRMKATATALAPRHAKPASIHGATPPVPRVHSICEWVLFAGMSWDRM